MLISDNHYALTSCKAVDQICQLLFHSTPISYFTHLRVYPDKTRIYLTSNANWVAHFFQQQFYELPYLGKPIHEYGNGLYSWDVDQNDPIAIAGREYFDIDHRLMIVDKNDNYADFYSFATNRSYHQAINYYLNHIDQLNQFFAFFKEQASPLISEYQQHRISIESTTTNKTHPTPLQQRPRWWLNNSEYLTPREFQCATLLKQGYGYKRVAQKMNISPKTVEKHIIHLKQKLNVRTKSELIIRLMRIGV